MTKTVRLVGAALLVTIAPAAQAQGVRLPIAEGVWVPVATPCGTATNIFAYGGGRFGSVYFYGPNYSMGPADETEKLTHVGRGKNGFTTVNDGPLEVAARPNGQAVVRAYSLSQNAAAWTENVRLCPAATLPAKTRAALARLGLITGR